MLLTQKSTALDAWVRLLRGHAAAKRELSAQLQRDHGLTINDYEVLLLLSHAEDGRLRRVDLAKDVILTPSGITRLLDGLQAAGYVKKATCSTDARVTYAVLTDAGRHKLEEASRSHFAGVRSLFEQRFTDEELTTLADLLARLPEATDADAADCAG
jgi:DNA-binding MarR family transcriptional regulator